MVFQGEDVPLTEDILKKETPFNQTKAEWSSVNRRQIITSVSNVSANTVIFTVPAANTLFITGVWVECNYNGTVGAISGANLFSSSFGQSLSDATIIGTTIDSGVASISSNSLNLSMPIKVEENATITLTAAVNEENSGGIIGWIEPKRLT